MHEILIALASSIVSSLVTFTGIFLTPLGAALAKRIASSTLHFTSDRYALLDNLSIIVRPANRVSSKRKPLSLAVGGQFFPNVAYPETDTRSIFWSIDLYESGLRDPLFNENGVEIQFYFDPDELWVPLRFTSSPRAAYVSALNRSQLEWSASGQFARASDTVSLIRGAVENGEVELVGAEIRLDLPMIVNLPQVNISNVYDGRELGFSGLSKLNLISRERTALLAVPRYAWVLGVADSSRLKFADIKLGHSNSGGCQGGVLKLSSCRGVEMTDCELFGLGTVGLELLGCREVLITRSVIHNCTYQIARLKDCRNITFDHCIFEGNGQFDGIVFDGELLSISFIECQFIRNAMSGVLLKILDDRLHCRTLVQILVPISMILKIDNTDANTKTTP
jgi:hypothetical protein